MNVHLWNRFPDMVIRPIPFDTQDPDATTPVRPRENEILDSIRQTFAEKGFDGASMQELARAAGMSVGNFYRYFPSKAAMVAAIITRDLEEVGQKFTDVVEAEDPLAALREGLHLRVAEECCGVEDASLWAEITAAAQRKPEIGNVVQHMERGITSYLVEAFALIAGMSRDEAERRFLPHAAMVVMLVKTTSIQAHGPSAQCRLSHDDLTALVQRLIDMILDEVAAARPKEPK